MFWNRHKTALAAEVKAHAETCARYEIIAEFAHRTQANYDRDTAALRADVAALRAALDLAKQQTKAASIRASTAEAGFNVAIARSHVDRDHAERIVAGTLSRTAGALLVMLRDNGSETREELDALRISGATRRRIVEMMTNRLKLVNPQGVINERGCRMLEHWLNMHPPEIREMAIDLRPPEPVAREVA